MHYLDIGIRKAFILAGGAGTRLRPITYELSKLVLPVQGKPILWWNIELVKRFGVSEVILAVGYKHEQIKDFWGNGKKFGVRIKYSVEKEFMGTAGALKMVERNFKREPKFIMMNGDECKDVDFAALNCAFEKNKAVAALALTPIDYL
ncbi:MAG: nucleotidyltransferase family protein, partial [Candidatus Diapherotrites archaeon]|nr:nucleotidyltransferase family protein [Candidatus Diapherotrites archaeon]